MLGERARPGRAASVHGRKGGAATAREVLQQARGAPLATRITRSSPIKYTPTSHCRYHVATEGVAQSRLQKSLLLTHAGRPVRDDGIMPKCDAARSCRFNGMNQPTLLHRKPHGYYTESYATLVHTCMDTNSSVSLMPTQYMNSALICLSCAGTAARRENMSQLAY